jgi:dolichol-phosphate mannosyltransferase
MEGCSLTPQLMTFSSRSSVSFIVFALNEESNIEATVQTIRDAVKGGVVQDYEVVLVNDGSTDATGSVMDRLASSDKKVISVHNEQNLGPGGAYKRGADAASCDYLMAVAGDNAAPAESIRATIEHLGEADIIVSYCRNPEIRRFTRRVGSRAFTVLINLLFGYRLPYYNGPVVLRKQIAGMSISSNGYAFFAEMVVKLLRNGSSYVNVGVLHSVNANACSSALKAKNLVKVFKDVLRLLRSVVSSSTGPAEARD